MLSVCLGLHEWPWAFLNPYSAENESLLDWCSLTLLIRYSSDWTFSFLKRSLCSWEAFASFCIRSKLRVFLTSCSCSLDKLWVVSTAKKVDHDSWNFCIIHSNTFSSAWTDEQHTSTQKDLFAQVGTRGWQIHWIWLGWLKTLTLRSQFACSRNSSKPKVTVCGSVVLRSVMLAFRTTPFSLSSIPNNNCTQHPPTFTIPLSTCKVCLVLSNMSSLISSSKSEKTEKIGKRNYRPEEFQS